MTILIIKTGDVIPELKGRGDFEDWFIAGLGSGKQGRGKHDYRVIDVTRDQPLPNDGYDAVVITGSPAMVTERLDWSERTARWLAAQHPELPMLGICYGHQLLAHAFGGVVANNPNGRQIGTIEVTFDGHTNDALLANLPATIIAQASHLQSVVEPPPQATVLASSLRDPNHVIRFRDRVWGLQFHPEWNAEITRGYLLARREAIECEGQDVDQLIANTSNNSQESILAGFSKQVYRSDAVLSLA